MSEQNNRERIFDLLAQGKISVGEANVRLVISQRVKLVRGSLPRDLRKVLNAAVKEGRLERLKKEGYLPEAYFRPENRRQAIEERRKHEREVFEAVLKVVER